MTEKKKKPYSAPKTRSKKVARAVTNAMRSLVGKEPLTTAPEPPPRSAVAASGLAEFLEKGVAGESFTQVISAPAGIPAASPLSETTHVLVISAKDAEKLGAQARAERTPDWEKALALLREARNSVPLSLSQRIDALLKGR